MIDVCVVQIVFGFCAVPSGTDADELLQARKEEHKSWRHVEQNPFAWEVGGVPDRDVRVMAVEGEK